MNTKLTTDQLQALTAEMNNYMTETGRKLFPPAKADELRELNAKRCSKCTTVKLIEDFGKASRSRDGLKNICKPCNVADKADYYRRNTDKVLEYNREYNREYREQNRERINKSGREYYQRIRERKLNRYRTDELHRLRRQLTDGYHRAVRAGNTAEWVTPEELLTYWAAKGIPALECYLTGESLTPFDRSIDHVVAIGNGGEHTVANLLPCTLEANMKKKSLDPDDAKEKLNLD